MTTNRTGKATGPRSAFGKERSEHNAVKHGIFSKVVVLKGELRSEYYSLWHSLIEDFNPVGPFEDGLVEMLAVTRWHQRRLLIAEGAEIRAEREFMEFDQEQKQLNEAGVRYAPDRRNTGLICKISSLENLAECLAFLRLLKSSVRGQGLPNPVADAIMSRLYGELDGTHFVPRLYLVYLISAQAATIPEHLRKPGSSPEDFKKDFLTVVDSEMDAIIATQAKRSLIEANRMDVEFLRRSLPDSARLDQLMRYGATLDRTFDRTLNQLERTQRIRRASRSRRQSA